ncbi:MAG: uvrD [Gammaproteobacteria bacterium]|jgi:DNA helicase-2/ATP-dependent DNA helicase PcrA|nr:uvrD [Gammaproteobacteria bacterium]
MINTAPDFLNNVQQEAVTSKAAHLLVLAGAGSGKTRVLVHRIVHLVQSEGVLPDEILAVTFTNKAAKEMSGRIEAMLNAPIHRLWVGTFHSMAHRLLRRHWQEAGLPQSFQVIDSDDQHRLVKRIMKDLNLDETHWPPRQAQWFINTKKEEGLRPNNVRPEDNFAATYLRVYRAYEALCQAGGLVDFSELLLRSYEMWNNCPELLAHYQKRFRHILVDEFQDTNWIQYNWLKRLAGESAHMMAVGDDDQSIYSWRGAQAEHLQRFRSDFPDTQVIKLEQNYRSTPNILNAANAVIENNTGRMGKNLWTQGKEGAHITVYAAFNDRDEARFVISRVKEWLSHGGRRQEVALLYRSNAQSRVLEEAFIEAGMPYRIYGGLKFFERAEIKDALGYLRLVSNRDDDGAFDRVVNLPARGIGESTLTLIRDSARDLDTSLWQAAHILLQRGSLSARAGLAVQEFITLVDNLDIATRNITLREQTQYLIKYSGILAHHSQEKSEKARARVENLEELVNAAGQFSSDPEEQDLPILTTFLTHISLESGERQGDYQEDAVHLMTLHAAKGLEFPLVFLTGLEEGLFPHNMSAQNLAQLEEERRLCYVGMTRAMQKLYLTYAEKRYLHGREMRQRPSRFIKEIPEELLSTFSAQTKVSRPVSFSRHAVVDATIARKNDAAFPLGSHVRHAKFGEGVVLNCEGSGEHARVQVRFACGTKWLVVSYSKLVSI